LADCFPELQAEADSADYFQSLAEADLADFDAELPASVDWADGWFPGSQCSGLEKQCSASVMPSNRGRSLHLDSATLSPVRR